MSRMVGNHHSNLLLRMVGNHASKFHTSMVKTIIEKSLSFPNDGISTLRFRPVVVVTVVVVTVVVVTVVVVTVVVVKVLADKRTLYLSTV